MKMLAYSAAALAAALVAMPSDSAAQVADTAKKTASVPPVESPKVDAKPAISDSAIIAMLQLAHTQQVAAADLAMQRAHSDRVKKFAEELKTDHAAGLLALENFAKKMRGETGMSSGVAGAKPDSARVGRDNNVTGRRDSAMVEKVEPRPGMPDSARTGRDVNANVGRTDSTMAKPEPGKTPEVSFENINALSGHEFDHGFVRLQVQHHENEIAHLRNDVIPMIRDSDLKALVQAELATLGKHLRQAMELEGYLKTVN